MVGPTESALVEVTPGLFPPSSAMPSNGFSLCHSISQLGLSFISSESSMMMGYTFTFLLFTWLFSRNSSNPLLDMAAISSVASIEFFISQIVTVIVSQSQPWRTVGLTVL